MFDSQMDMERREIVQLMRAHFATPEGQHGSQFGVITYDADGKPRAWRMRLDEVLARESLLVAIYHEARRRGWSPTRGTGGRT